MPRQLPNSLAAVPPEEPNEPHVAGVPEVAEQNPVIPDDVLRVLGGIGLPGDAPIERIEEVDIFPEPCVVTPASIGPEPMPVVTAVYGAQEGLNNAQQQRRRYGPQSALDVLSQTERTAETDAYHDEIVLAEAQSGQRRHGQAAARDFLDKTGLRTTSAREQANEFYDTSIITEAGSIKRRNGSDAVLDYIDACAPRISETKPILDKLYDETIISEAQSRQRRFGKDAALDYLTQRVPKTAGGVQTIEQLRQQIQASRR